MILGKKKKRNEKSKTACFLSLMILMGFLAGCSTVGSSMEAENSADKSGGENGDISVKAMGRYVEETTDLSDKISGRGNSLYRLSDGKLLISDRNGEFIKTEDNGKLDDGYERIADENAGRGIFYDEHSGRAGQYGGAYPADGCSGG